MSTMMAHRHFVVHKYMDKPLVHKYKDRRWDGIQLPIVQEDSRPRIAYYEYKNGVRPTHYTQVHRQAHYTQIQWKETGRRMAGHLCKEDGPFVREYEDGTVYSWPLYARRMG